MIITRDSSTYIAHQDGVRSYGVGESEDAAVADFWRSARIDYALLRKDADRLSEPLRHEMVALGQLLARRAHERKRP